MVLARFLESGLATVGEIGLVSLEACADVPMPDLGVLTEPISVGGAGHMHVREIPSPFVCGRPGRP
jgi:hypothetical protein